MSLRGSDDLPPRTTGAANTETFAMPNKVVFFDVGETLVDESRL
jgi:hypothetical protein